MAKDRDDSSTNLPEDQDFPFQDDDLDEVEEVEDLEEVDFEEVEEVEEVEELSDSAVDLGDAVPGEENASGESVIDWANMIEGEDENDSSVTFDSPSDVDLLSQAGLPVDSDAENVYEEVDEDDSAINLGEEVLEVDSAIDLGEEALEVEEVEEIDASDSAVTLGEEVLDIESGVDIVENDSVVNLGEEVLEPEVIDSEGTDSDSVKDLSELIEAEVLDSSNDEIPVVEDLSDDDAPTMDQVGDQVGDHAGAPKTVLAEDLQEVVDLSQPDAEVEAPSSGVDFAEIEESAESVDLGEDSEELDEVGSGINLGELAEDGESVEEVEEVAAHESGAELDSLFDNDEEQSVEESADRAADEVLVDETLAEVEAGSSGVNLGEETGDKGSSRDLIAEAVESGTDLVDAVPDLSEELGDLDEVEDSEDAEDLVIESFAETDQETLDEVEAIDEVDELEEEEVDFGSDIDPYESASSVDLGDPGDVTLEELASRRAFKDSELPTEEDELEDVFLDDDLAEGTDEAAIEDEDELELPDMPAAMAADFDDDSDFAADIDDVALDSGIGIDGPDGPDGPDDDVVRVSLDDVVGDKRPAATGSRFGAVVGGMMAGGVLAVAACVGAWLYGYEPPEEWKSKFGRPSEQAGTKQDAGPTGVPVTLAETGDYLQNGNLDLAEKAGIETIDESKPEMLALRGEYRWKKYLQNTAQAGGEIDTNDPKVQQALQDLQNADTADAQLQLAQIHMLSGNLDEAEKIYREGQTKYPTDRRFESGLTQVELLREATKPDPQARMFPNTAFAYLLVALYQPGGVAPAPAPAPGGNPPVAVDPDAEAGFDFWQAVKNSRELKYAEALQLLQKAQELHKKTRFLRIGKAQNPDSDPNEQIFLRCCRELESYWKLQEKLQKGGYLADGQKDPVQATADVVQTAEQGKQAATKLTDAAIIAKPDELAKGVDKLLADRKTNTDTIASLMKELDTTKKTLLDTNTKLTDTRKQLTDAETKVAELDKSLKDATELLTSAKNELVDAKYLDAKAGQDKVLPSLQMALEVAKQKDPAGKIRTLTDEVAMLKNANKQQIAMLKVQHMQQVMTLQTKHQMQVKGLETELSTRWKPDQMLSIWRPALLETRDGDLAGKALSDADRVKADATADTKTKGQAEAIRGLALRNQNQYPRAKTALESAQRALADVPLWKTTIDDVLAEVSNPAQYHEARAQKLVDAGQIKQALDALNQMIAVVPVKEPLYARRSLLLLEDAHKRHDGNIPFNEPILEKAQADAQLAEEAGLAEGFYASGRIAEIMGRRDQAIAKYREALKLHPAADEQGSRYRAALARILTINAGEGPLPGGVGYLPLLQKFANALALADEENPEKALEQFTEEEMKLFLTMVAIGFQPPWAGLNPERDEAMKLADEILAADPSTVSFEARAQAYMIKGQYTKALETLSEGVSKNLPSAQAVLLRKLIEQHPALKREKTPSGSNPLEAEKLYGDGLRLYFAGNYTEAEKYFEEAIKYNDQDARYFYYLALTNWNQSKPKTAEYFERAAQLEQQGMPSREAVSKALERIQGTTRQALNIARDRFRER